jgi:pyruvate,water dikinase
MIRFFDSIKKEDIAIVGGKGANLGEMYGKFNVPNGFVVTTKAYNTFVEMKELEEDIASMLKDLDPGDHSKLEKVSAELKKYPPLTLSSQQMYYML